MKERGCVDQVSALTDNEVAPEKGGKLFATCTDMKKTYERARIYLICCGCIVWKGVYLKASGLLQGCKYL